MTDDRALTRDEEADLTAAEYVMGVLPLDERVAAEARIKSDAGFAARISAWETHMADLNDEFDEVPAPAEMLGRVEARLFPQAARTRRVWLGWLTGALAATVLGVAALIVSAPPPAPTAHLIATLGTGDDALLFEARYDGASLTVARTKGAEAAAGRVHELWIIAPEAAPVSLGLLGDAPLSIPYPMPPAGWILAVTLEPSADAPHSAPTGPIVASGAVTDL